MKPPYALAAILLFVSPVPVFGAPFDVDEAVRALTDAGRLPRRLNTEDIPDLRPGDPQPMSVLQSDVSGEGWPEAVIPGVFDAPRQSDRYFLLIARLRTAPPRYQTLHMETFPSPAFVHMPGTTGITDPGDQAFSVSLCTGCPDGWDYYWNGEAKRFDRRAWVRTEKRQMVLVPEEPVPGDVVEAALRAVSALPDVQAFIAASQAAGRRLMTTVARGDGPSPHGVGIKVTIGDTAPDGGETLFDVITVDTETGAVLARERAPHTAE